MPVMNICDQDGNLTYAATGVVIATMACPRPCDRTLRQQLIASHEITNFFNFDMMKEIAAKDRKHLDCVLNFMDVLYQAPAADKLILDLYRRTRWAWLAGTIFLQLIRNSDLQDEIEISPTKAISAITTYLANHPEFNEPGAPSKDRALWRIWARFKSTAHLHAATSIYYSTLKVEEPPLGQLLLRDDFVLDSHLAIAEELRELGEKSGWLDPSKTWRTHDHFVRQNMGLSIPPLDDEFLELYRSYTPKHYSGIVPIE